MVEIFPSTLRIATRQSPLALWQANYVKQRLHSLHPTLNIEIIGLITQGDRLLSSSLAKIGGKGLFVKELEQALLDQRADIAVHSIKDLPAELPEKLILAAICEREDPRDALVSPHFSNLESLPRAAVIGTSSSRRCCELKAFRPDLITQTLRGNVGTRLKKLDAGQYDGIILAAAGLKRLHEEQRIRCYLDTDYWIPAAGQGAIGIECHADNHLVRSLLHPLEHSPTRLCITAERAATQALGGGCQLPIAAYAKFTGNELTIRGLVGDATTHQLITACVTGAAKDAQQLGLHLAQQLLQQGAQAILDSISYGTKS